MKTLVLGFLVIALAAGVVLTFSGANFSSKAQTIYNGTAVTVRPSPTRIYKKTCQTDSDCNHPLCNRFRMACALFMPDRAMKCLQNVCVAF